MTRGPLTAYSIFLMQGFIFSNRRVGTGATVADAEDILRSESAIMLLLLKAIILVG
jgi:hypothetical protein